MTTPILLTNDDGYDAPGLKALWECAVAFGDCQVAAPATPWSVRSHATTVDPKAPIKVSPLALDGMRGVVVDGYPADCTRVGLLGIDLFQGKRPLVLAGINGGANVGVDAFYSGTLAAAREAVALGCSAIALSLLTSKELIHDWDRTSRWAKKVLEWLIPLALENTPTLWNVNLPCRPNPPDAPEIRIVPMSTDPLAVAFKPHNGDPRVLAYSGPYYDRHARPGTDVEALFSGAITVTPMSLDHTHHGLLESTRKTAGLG